MNKKEIAETFLKMVSSGKVREAYEKYVHPDFSTIMLTLKATEKLLWKKWKRISMKCE